MTKFYNPKRYKPDYRMSISHELVYMKEVNEQGYIDGALYDELYAEYRQLTLIGTVKNHLIRFLGKHIWKFIIIYCIGALALLVWLITLIV